MKAKTVREFLEAKNPVPKDRDYFSINVSYDDAFFDMEIVVQETVGSYQGDYIYLVKHGAKYGYTVVGYGSCGGCDALEAARGYDSDRERQLKDVTEQLERVRSGVHWEPSKTRMAKYLKDEVDKEMAETYMSDRAEKAKVWEKLQTAVK